MTFNRCIFLIILFAYTSVFCINDAISQENTNKTLEFWKKSKLENVVDFKVFDFAMKGYNSIEKRKNNLLVIIDYSKASTKDRFFVIDVENKKLLHKCLVAHGKNTGNNFAKSFSNTPKSQQSSLGFFLTAETYFGKHGYSLKLDGLEKGINDKARERAIVIHAAWYVSHEFAKQHGRIGRSWGCPALPSHLTKEIIDLIANGTCLFIYGSDDAYPTKSSFLN